MFDAVARKNIRKRTPMAPLLLIRTDDDVALRLYRRLRDLTFDFVEKRRLEGVFVDFGLTPKPRENLQTDLLF